MFAFGIWDTARKKLFLARDRFGIKPLYYHDGDRFIFASEIKGIVSDPSVPRKLDMHGVADFFVYRFIPGPRSIWQAIRKLPPAHYLEYADGAVHVHRYWALCPGADTPPEQDVYDRAHALLENAVREHLVSDIPVGLFLSGGYDSGVIAYTLQQLGYRAGSFTIGFRDWAKSEHGAAREAARCFNTDHHERMIDEQVIALRGEVMYYYDEPLGGTSILPAYLLARFAREKTKVALAGDGGDEVFTGYNRYDEVYRTYTRRFAFHPALRIGGWTPSYLLFVPMRGH